MAIGVNGGVSRSVDGGATWEALPVSGSVRLLTVDPAKPSNLIVGRTNGGLAEIEIAPDLATTIPSSPAVLGLGGGGTATFRVTNRGPFAASSVKLTIDVAPNTRASAFPPPQGSCAQTGATVTCALGGIRLNQQADVVLTLTGGAAASTGVVTATVAAHESAPDASKDAASATIEVLRLSDLSASLSASAATVDHNAPVTLTAVASNAGPNDATAAQLTVALGAGYTFQSATPSQGSCSDASGTVTCDFGPIAANAQASVALNVLAGDTGTLTASATVSSAGRADGNAANDSATTSVTSRPIANVGVRIADSADPAVSGQPFQYTVTVTNAGPDDLAGGTAQITLTGSTASSAVATQGTCAAAGATVSCPLGAVPKNGTATITISATPSFAGSATASANLAHNAADPDSSNDHASESTVVNAPPSSGGGGSGGGGGGGGAVILELALLLALTALRGIQRSRRGRQAGGRPRLA
jgi:uncharacterized repeat protein (TIGR01451 family)